MIWYVLTAVALIILAFYWRGPNAVWGTLSAAVFIGAIFTFVKGDWSLLAKSAIIGTIAGFAIEIPELIKKSVKKS